VSATATAASTPVVYCTRTRAAWTTSVPRSRGGKDAWENLVWSAKEVNQRKADRLPHEAGLKLLAVPRAPKELPVSALIRNSAEVEDWKQFLT
jgi:5-methylcytosine-specific restriction endonuclease McrA